VVAPPSKEYRYPGVPSDPATVTDPVAPPLQSTFV